MWPTGNAWYRPRSPRRSRLLAAGLASIAGVTLLAACGSSGSGSVNSASAKCPGGKVTVTEEDYYLPASSTNILGTDMSNFFGKYSQSHTCVTVTRQAPSTSTDSAYLTHVLSQFSSGNEPDLLMLDNPQLAEFAAKGLLVPLSSLGSIQTSEINPANLAESTYQGQLYAMPLYTNTIAIFYNKTLLRQAGITTLPATWAEFAADAKKAASGNVVGFAFSGIAGPGNATWQFDPWSWSNGGTTADADSTAAIQALSFLSGMVKDGAAPKDVVNWNQTQVIQEFEAGKAAFAENGLWNIPTLKQQFPKLNWGVIEIPTRVAGQKVIAPFGGEVWAIPRTNAAEEKAAFGVLQAMSTPSQLASFSREATDVPTDPALWDQPPWNTSVYAPFLAELRNGRARTAGIADPANEPQIDLNIGNAIQEALIGSQAPAAALAAAQRQNASLLGG
jgi:multiple sugar transport system substrate-binding protein